MKKQVNIRYFAAYREAADRAEERLETTASTVRELFAEVCSRHPRLQAFPATRVAVNDEMAEWTTAVEDGDEVLLFPPVAGG